MRIRERKGGSYGDGLKEEDVAVIVIRFSFVQADKDVYA